MSLPCYPETSFEDRKALHHVGRSFGRGFPAEKVASAIIIEVRDFAEFIFPELL